MCSPAEKAASTSGPAGQPERAPAAREAPAVTVEPAVRNLAARGRPVSRTRSVHHGARPRARCPAAAPGRPGPPPAPSREGVRSDVTDGPRPLRRGRPPRPPSAARSRPRCSARAPAARRPRSPSRTRALGHLQVRRHGLALSGTRIEDPPASGRAARAPPGAPRGVSQIWPLAGGGAVPAKRDHHQECTLFPHSVSIAMRPVTVQAPALGPMCCGELVPPALRGTCAVPLEAQRASRYTSPPRLRSGDAVGLTSGCHRPDASGCHRPNAIGGEPTLGLRAARRGCGADAAEPPAKAARGERGGHRHAPRRLAEGAPRCRVRRCRGAACPLAATRPMSALQPGASRERPA